MFIMHWIRDQIYGSIEICPMASSLIDTPEFSRLADVKQLGSAYLIYPGGSYARKEHAIGTYHIAGEIAKQLSLYHRGKLLEAAALLHDLGHGPFSHSSEKAMIKRLGYNHEELTKRIITGENIDGKKFMKDRRYSGKIAGILAKHNIDPKEVGALIASKHPNKLLQEVIHGKVDSDQLDFLKRDSYNTGMDISLHHDRLLSLMRIKIVDENEEIVFHENSRAALQGFVCARNLMFSDVYLHKASIMYQTVLENAILMSFDRIGDFWEYQDAVLLDRIRKDGAPESKELLEAIYDDRENGFRTAFAIPSRTRSPEENADLQKIENTRNQIGDPGIESRIYERAKKKIPELESHLIMINYPLATLETSEDRLNRKKIPVLMKTGEIKYLHEIDPISKTALETDAIPAAFSVFTLKEYIDKVKEVVIEFVSQL